MDLNNKETKNLTAFLILEIIGRPAEHLTKTLNEIIEKIDNEPRVSVKEKKIAEPKEIENSNEFYSSFAEIEVETEGILDLVILCFRYMPANVEIVNPELIAITNNSWSDILNELLRKLHKYDEIARVSNNERAILENRLKELLEKKKENVGKEEKTEKKKVSNKK